MWFPMQVDVLLRCWWHIRGERVKGTLWWWGFHIPLEEVRYLFQVDCKKLNIYIAIPRAATKKKKSIQRNIDKPKWNTKECSNNPKEGVCCRLNNNHLKVTGPNSWNPKILLYKGKVFAGTIKIRFLKWRDYSGLTRWILNAATCTFIKQRQREFP